MANAALYVKKYLIELRDVDFKNELKLSMLLSYCQETASLAASALGIGIKELAEESGIAWILMRMKIEVERMPELGEEIVIETWPQQPGRLEFERDFLIKDPNGNVLIRAVSMWVLMDMKERKLKRTSAISIQYPDLDKERAIVHTFKRLKSSQSLIPVYEKSVGYSDIDFNGHLNNSRYINYLMDCFPLKEHRKYEIKSLEVNFIQEAFPGDTLVLKKDAKLQTEQTVFIEGANKKSGKPIFRAKLEARERT